MNLQLFKNNKNLTLLLLGRFVSGLGGGVQQFAFSLYVLRLTGSATYFASVLVAGMIPSLFLGPICGVFADWFDRKKIIVYLDLLSGILYGGMYLISITSPSSLTMAHIYFTVVATSIISSLFNPAINSAIPSIVEKDDLMEANSLNRLLMTITMIISPILAGALFPIGISLILLLNSISFILSAISEAFINLKSPNKKTDFSLCSFKSDFKTGVSFIVNHSLIRKIISLSFVANAFFAPVLTVGLMFIASEVLKVSEIQIGAMNSSLMVGSMLGALIAGAIGKKYPLYKTISAALWLMGIFVCLIGFASLPAFLGIFSSSLVPYLTIIALCIIIASATVVTNVGMATLMQREVPLEIMGRVSSVKDTASMCATPVGQLLFAFLMDTTGSFIPIIISGAVMIVGATLFNYSVSRDALQKKTLQSAENPA